MSATMRPSPELLKGPIVFFTLHLEKIKDLDEICYREKPIKCLPREVSSDIFYGIVECYVVDWVTVVLKQ